MGPLRAATAFLLLTILTIPGAAGAGAHSGPVGGATITKTGEHTLDVKGEYQLLVRQARIGPVSQSSSENHSGKCVTMQGNDPGFRVLEGKATLVWKAESPLAQRMSLTYQHGGHVLRAEGYSPVELTLPYEGLRTGRAELRVGVVGGAAIDQPVTVAVKFSVEVPSIFAIGNAEPCGATK